MRETPATLRFFGAYALAHREGRLLLSTPTGPRDITPGSVGAFVRILERLPRETLTADDVVWLIEGNPKLNFEAGRTCVDTPFGPELFISGPEVVWSLVVRPEKVSARPVGRVARTAA